ncbi:MAG: hypothetical protein KIT43_12165 [Bauldia sp.]|nr:hypothetical protein [Bauldia sp.]MCW5718967.1 hypothetical protein [Bauldia sp.]
MDDVIAATGGPQYNVLRRLRGRGYAVRSVKEGRRTRYYARAPEVVSLTAVVDGKGRVTLPEPVREALRLTAGQSVSFAVSASGSAEMTPVRKSVQRLFGILGRPPRAASEEEINGAGEMAAVERYRRTVSNS